jgi:hypothetical protein
MEQEVVVESVRGEVLESGFEAGLVVETVELVWERVDLEAWEEVERLMQETVQV